MDIVGGARWRAVAFLSSGISIALGLAIVTGWGAYARLSMLDPVIFSYNGFGHGPPTSDIWFDGDIPKTFFLMNNVNADQHNAAEHPWLSFISYPPAETLRWLGLSPVESVRATYGIASGIWSIVLLALLRLCGVRMFDASLFATLGVTSASAVFWMAGPDSFLLGSITICVALCLTKWPTGGGLIQYTILNIISLSVTVTNWMVGLLLTYRRLPLREAWVAAATAWFIICAVCVPQKIIFPKSEFFTSALATAQSFTYVPTVERTAMVAQSFFFHTIVMPELVMEIRDDFLGLSVQRAIAGSASTAGTIATISWISLLALGAWSLLRLPRSSLAVSCGILVLAQLALHLVHGSETFLYSMHFLPLLVVVAAAATQTQFRSIALVLALVVGVFGGLNNWWQFQKARDFVAERARAAQALVPK